MKHRDEEDKATFRNKFTADPALVWKIHGRFHCSKSWSRKIPQASSFGNRVYVIKLTRSQNFTIELQLLWHRRLWKLWMKWGLRNSMKWMCFDNTHSNTGVKGGVFVLLESWIGWVDFFLTWLVTTTFEIMLEKIFSLHDVSKSSNMKIFRHLKDYWPKIDRTSFSTVIKDEVTSAASTSCKEDVMEYAVAQLEWFHPRDDYYCELFEYTIIFLEYILSRWVPLRYPGTIHRARLDGYRAIYSIKMWLFRNQYNPM